MKFITPSWEDSPKTWNTFRQNIADHYRHLQDVLPAHVSALADLKGVDDGLLVEVCYDRQSQIITIVMRCGDAPSGYYDLILRYGEAEILLQDEQLLAQIARGTIDQFDHQSDLNRQELDVTVDGGIEHRLEFHMRKRPNAWLTIRCRTLDWETISQPNRELPILSDRFPSGPDIAG